ncbi:MAG: 3-hydroxyacyl-CoA dehydrogenase family protein [Deltaproteobacteria bacterium]|nr:3-hydroxyacyl-CoA dehydrogenase family protein [Deltaproteobacteria bacterium]MBW2120217.1 3-hydroxyacyl-CoA dehydrogenase family protein [Deltaproteobacteria bacterium]
MEIKKIFVVGSGLMGAGITQVCAQAGYGVTMMDVEEEIIQKGLKNIQWSVSKLVEKKKVAGTCEEIMGRITWDTRLEAAADADFVFEAVFEDLELKSRVFSELDRICAPGTIFGTNTSAIPITEIAEATGRPDKVVGTHFFSPVPMMRVVEVIKGLKTSEQTLKTATELCESLGKEVIRVNKDVAGFALNRFNAPATVEAIRLVELGVVSVEDLDKGARLGFGRPMGPFETGDMAGLDVGLNAISAMYQETGDPKFKPPMLLQRKVKAGQLGRKTGIGWYRYDENGKKIGPAD